MDDFIEKLNKEWREYHEKQIKICDDAQKRIQNYKKIIKNGGNVHP